MAKENSSSGVPPDLREWPSIQTLLDAAYAWERVPQGSAPHPEIVVARANDMLQKALNLFGPVERHFHDPIARAQLIEYGAEQNATYPIGGTVETPLEPRPAIASTEIQNGDGGSGPSAIASSNRGKASRERSLVEEALHKVANCYHEILNEAGGIDIDNLIASLCNDHRDEDHCHIRNLIEQICKQVPTRKERRSSLSVLKEGKGRGSHVRERRNFVFAAILYEIVHRHCEVLHKGSIDTRKLATSVSDHREFHGLGEDPTYVLNLIKKIFPRKKK